MTATVGVATSGSRPELINDAYWRLRRMGFDDPDAANLAALSNGFGICAQPWTVREVTHILFLRESYRVGRLWSDTDDRADGTEWSPVPAPVERVPAPAVEDGATVLAVPARHGDEAPSSDGRVTLLTLFRSMAGPGATLDSLRPSTPSRLDATGDSGREGG
jgi:hypothetical protein